MKTSRVPLSWCLLAVALLASACGKKGPPLAPLMAVPARIADLTARRIGDTVYLKFTIPAMNAIGTKPADLARVDVFAFTALSPYDVLDVRDMVRVASITVRRPPDPEPEPKVEKPPKPGEEPKKPEKPKKEEPPKPPKPPKPREPGEDQGALFTVTEELTPTMQTVTVGARNPKKRQVKWFAPVTKLLDEPPMMPPLGSVVFAVQPTRFYVAMGVSRHGVKAALSSFVGVSLQLAPPSAPAAPVLTVAEKSVGLVWEPPAGAPDPPYAVPRAFTELDAFGVANAVTATATGTLAAAVAVPATMSAAAASLARAMAAAIAAAPPAAVPPAAAGAKPAAGTTPPLAAAGAKPAAGTTPPATVAGAKPAAGTATPAAGAKPVAGAKPAAGTTPPAAVAGAKPAAGTTPPAAGAKPVAGAATPATVAGEKPAAAATPAITRMPPPLAPLVATPRGMVLPVLLGYNVYLSGVPVPPPAPPTPGVAPPAPVPISAGTLAPIPLNPAPLATPTFQDTTFVFDTERCYEVRAVNAVGVSSVRAAITLPIPGAPVLPPPPPTAGPPRRPLVLLPPVWFESASSVTACVTPKDIFPPPVPTSLAAVGSVGAINLIWEGVEAADLAGYVVLRGTAPDGPMTPLFETPMRETTYRDTTVKPGVRYVYTVMSVDKATPPNRSLPSNKADEVAR